MEILEKTKLMSLEERQELLKALINDLDLDADKNEVVWLEEVEKRREEIKSGKVETISHQEMRGKFGWQ